MVKNFRYWCQSVLPLVYDDSLSYYELLCKLVDHVNHLSADVNGTISEIAEVREAVDTLREFVTDYFKNLDIQDEINAKLDDMAENGTLDDVVMRAITVQILGVHQCGTINGSGDAQKLDGMGAYNNSSFIACMDGWMKAVDISNYSVTPLFNLGATSNSVAYCAALDSFFTVTARRIKRWNRSGSEVAFNTEINESIVNAVAASEDKIYALTFGDNYTTPKIWTLLPSGSTLTVHNVTGLPDNFTTGYKQGIGYFEGFIYFLIGKPNYLVKINPRSGEVVAILPFMNNDNDNLQGEVEGVAFLPSGKVVVGMVYDTFIPQTTGNPLADITAPSVLKSYSFFEGNMHTNAPAQIPVLQNNSNPVIYVDGTNTNGTRIGTSDNHFNLIGEVMPRIHSGSSNEIRLMSANTNYGGIQVSGSNVLIASNMGDSHNDDVVVGPVVNRWGTLKATNISINNCDVRYAECKFDRVRFKGTCAFTHCVINLTRCTFTPAEKTTFDACTVIGFPVSASMENVTFRNCTILFETDDVFQNIGGLTINENSVVLAGKLLTSAQSDVNVVQAAVFNSKTNSYTFNVVCYDKRNNETNVVQIIGNHWSGGKYRCPFTNDPAAYVSVTSDNVFTLHSNSPENILIRNIECVAG